MAEGSKERRQNGYKPDAIISRGCREIAFLNVKPLKEKHHARLFLEDHWKLANFYNSINSRWPRISNLQGAPLSKVLVNGECRAGIIIINLDISKTPSEDMIKELATRVTTFLDDFQRFYDRTLIKALFDKMP